MPRARHTQRGRFCLCAASNISGGVPSFTPQLRTAPRATGGPGSSVPSTAWRRRRRQRCRSRRVQRRCSYSGSTRRQRQGRAMLRCTHDRLCLCCAFLVCKPPLHIRAPAGTAAACSWRLPVLYTRRRPLQQHCNTRCQADGREEIRLQHEHACNAGRNTSDAVAVSRTAATCVYF